MLCDVTNNRRSFTSIVAGCVAGVLGLTGVMGFLFYFFAAAIVSAVLLVKTNLHIKVLLLVPFALPLISHHIHVWIRS
jgi:hypothetical protein